jgi:hypothetical protein
MTKPRTISPSVLAVAVLVLFGVAQIVPYGRQHENPPVADEPAWDSPATRALAVRACFDCHSNQTRWPAYSSIAPASWLIYHDVIEGREVLNLSEWQRPQEEAAEAADVVREMEMPPLAYRLMHPEARLTEVEREALVRGLADTFDTANAKNAAALTR